MSAVPEIANNSIVGGSSSVATVAVQVATSSSPLLHDNQITAGASSGSASTGISIGKALALTGDRAIRGNVIMGGSAIGSTTPGSIAVVVSATSVDLIGNVIINGSTTCPSGACVTYGVYLDSQGFSSRIAGNRIVGGAASGGSSQLVAGIQMVGTTTGWVVNNAIQASVAGTPTETSVGVGLSIVQGSNLRVQQNTLYGSSFALSVQNANDVAVQNNLLLGQTAETTAAFSLNNCGADGVSTLSAFTNNALVGFGTVLMERSDPTGCSERDLSTLAALEGSFAAGIASGNKRLAGSTTVCGADAASACDVVADCSPTQATASKCIDHVIGTWDDASEGAANLSDLTRSWGLVSGAPCIISQGGGAPLADPFVADAGTYDDSIDITGATRTPPVSIGAYENDVQCTN